jgi:fatty acid desaturase
MDNSNDEVVNLLRANLEKQREISEGTSGILKRINFVILWLLLIFLVELWGSGLAKMMIQYPVWVLGGIVGLVALYFMVMMVAALFEK